MKYTQEEIIQLAKEVELSDEIDWEGLWVEITAHIEKLKGC